MSISKKPIRRHTGYPAAALSVLALFLSGCERNTDTDEVIAPEASPRDELAKLTNCLIIVLDALPAKRSSTWGYPRETTPHLDRYAREGFVFRQAHSQATSTLPSAWSYFTGKYLYRPNMEPPVVRLRPIDPSLAEAFARAGFATGAFSENPYIKKSFGFDRGFEEFFFTPYTTLEKFPQSYVRDDEESRLIAAKAQDWIATVKERPWFGYVHILRPHNPYPAPEPHLSVFAGDHKIPDGMTATEYFNQKDMDVTPEFTFNDVIPSAADLAILSDLFDGNVAFADVLANQLIEALGELGELNETLVIITSDHGEGFMEHGVIMHGGLPYQEKIHVPLVFYAPGVPSLAGRRTEKIVELVDLFPTLSELFELGASHEMDGASLTPYLRGDAHGPSTDAFSEDLKTRSISAHVGRWKIVSTLGEDRSAFVKHEIFDLQADPGEAKNVYGSDVAPRELVEAVHRYNASRLTGEDVEDVVLTQEEIDRMRGLGYLD